MSTGRKYIEKMMEGISNFDMAGGTLLYKRKRVNVGSDTTLTEAQSGALVTMIGTGITASLPQATSANEGIFYHIANGVAADTANLFITASSGGQIVGSIGAAALGNDGAHASVSAPKYGMKASSCAIGDSVEVTSVGTLWVITNSNVSGSTWELLGAGAI
tara:strand:+ start:746 stop:1228 length:483 start_codon:yes stop_codon:yes gene_type:complete